MEGFSRTKTLGTSQRALVVLSLLQLLAQASALYHTSSEILHWFSHTAAKHPSLLRFRELKEHHTHTAVPIASITAGADAHHHTHRKPVVLFVFGEHAREVITSEVAIWLARMLVDNTSAVYTWPELAAAFERAGNSSDSSTPSSAATSSNSSSTDWAATAKVWVQELLQVLEVQIVPLEALDSRRQVEEGQLCVRKTGRNVDLNRNWPFAWRKEDPNDEQYGGPNPFSEPQSRLMKQIVDAAGNRLLGYVNVHSGEWALYTPWDSKPAYGTGMPADMQLLVDTVGRVCNCKAGPAGAVSGYLAFGSSMDYVYVHKKVPYPLTVEVYGGGDVGKLRPDESNTVLTAFDLIEKPTSNRSSATASTPRRHTLLQQHKQLPIHQAGVQQISTTDQQQRHNLPLLNSGRALLQHSIRGRQLKRQASGSGLVATRRRKLRRHRLLVSNEGADDLPYAAVLPSVAALDSGVTAEASDARATNGFTHGKDLPALRQQALLQLTQQQLSQLSSLRTTAAAAGVEAPSQPLDAILELVAKAPAHMQACFRAFNPGSEAEYRRVVADWLAAFVLILRQMSQGEGMKDIAAASVHHHSRG